MHSKLYLESQWMKSELPNISLKVFSVEFLKENLYKREGADTEGLKEWRVVIRFKESLQRETTYIELYSPW
jgi:hypothetical protein